MEQVEVIDSPRTIVSVGEAALAEFGNWREPAKALVEKFAQVTFDLTTPKGYEACVKARAEVRAPRYAAQKAAEKAKAALETAKRSIGAELEQIKEALAPTEAKLHQLIVDEDARRARVKEEERQAKAAREAEFMLKIGRITACVELARSMTAARIAEGLARLEKLTIGPEWAEFASKAEAAKAATLSSVRELLVQRQIEESAPPPVSPAEDQNPAGAAVTHGESLQLVAAHDEPSQAKPTHNGSSQPEPACGDTTQAGAYHADSEQPDPAQPDSAQLEPNQEKPEAVTDGPEIEKPARLTLSEITARANLPGLLLTVKTLEVVGFTKVDSFRNSALYNESDVPAIFLALAKKLTDAAKV